MVSQLVVMDSLVLGEGKEGDGAVCRGLFGVALMTG